MSFIATVTGKIILGALGGAVVGSLATSKGGKVPTPEKLDIAGNLQSYADGMAASADSLIATEKKFITGLAETQRKNLGHTLFGKDTAALRKGLKEAEAMQIRAGEALETNKGYTKNAFLQTNDGLLFIRGEKQTMLANYKAAKEGADAAFMGDDDDERDDNYKAVEQGISILNQQINALSDIIDKPEQPLSDKQKVDLQDLRDEVSDVRWDEIQSGFVESSEEAVRLADERVNLSQEALDSGDPGSVDLLIKASKMMTEASNWQNNAARVQDVNTLTALMPQVVQAYEDANPTTTTLLKESIAFSQAAKTRIEEDTRIPDAASDLFDLTYEPSIGRKALSTIAADVESRTKLETAAPSAMELLTGEMAEERAREGGPATGTYTEQQLKELAEGTLDITKDAVIRGDEAIADRAQELLGVPPTVDTAARGELSNVISKALGLPEGSEASDALEEAVNRLDPTITEALTKAGKETLTRGPRDVSAPTDRMEEAGRVLLERDERGTSDVKSAIEARALSDIETPVRERSETEQALMDFAMDQLVPREPTSSPSSLYLEDLIKDISERKRSNLAVRDVEQELLAERMGRRRDPVMLADIRRRQDLADEDFEMRKMAPVTQGVATLDALRRSAEDAELRRLGLAAETGLQLPGIEAERYREELLRTGTGVESGISLEEIERLQRAERTAELQTGTGITAEAENIRRQAEMDDLARKQVGGEMLTGVEEMGLEEENLEQRRKIYLAEALKQEQAQEITSLGLAANTAEAMAMLSNQDFANSLLAYQEGRIAYGQLQQSATSLRAEERSDIQTSGALTKSLADVEATKYTQDVESDRLALAEAGMTEEMRRGREADYLTGVTSAADIYKTGEGLDLAVSGDRRSDIITGANLVSAEEALLGSVTDDYITNISAYQGTQPDPASLILDRPSSQTGALSASAQGIGLSGATGFQVTDPNTAINVGMMDIKNRTQADIAEAANRSAITQGIIKGATSVVSAKL